jgi:non-ribosomal peptide synthetase component F
MKVTASNIRHFLRALRSFVFAYRTAFNTVQAQGATNPRIYTRMTRRVLERIIMPNDSHQRAAEFHELAAHAHRAAAVHHEKADHLTGHELSQRAFEMSLRAHEASQFAHQKSQKAAQKTDK